MGSDLDVDLFTDIFVASAARFWDESRTRLFFLNFNVDKCDLSLFLSVFEVDVVVLDSMFVCLKVMMYGVGMLLYVLLYRDLRSKIIICLSSCSSFDFCEIFMSLFVCMSLFMGRFGKMLFSLLCNMVFVNKLSIICYINLSVFVLRRSSRRLFKSERGRMKLNIVVCVVVWILLWFGFFLFVLFVSVLYKVKVYVCGCDL